MDGPPFQGIDTVLSPPSTPPQFSNICTFGADLICFGGGGVSGRWMAAAVDSGRGLPPEGSQGRNRVQTWDKMATKASWLSLRQPEVAVPWSMPWGDDGGLLEASNVIELSLISFGGHILFATKVVIYSLLLVPSFQFFI